MFQQFDTIPSDVPVKAAANPPVKAAKTTRLRVRTLVGLAIMAFSLVTIAYQVMRTFDSWALGVLAADVVFLTTVAFWTSFGDRGRR